MKRKRRRRRRPRRRKRRRKKEKRGGKNRNNNKATHFVDAPKRSNGFAQQGSHNTCYMYKRTLCKEEQN